MYVHTYNYAYWAPILYSMVGQVHKGLPLIYVRFHEQDTTDSCILSTGKPDFRGNLNTGILLKNKAKSF